jgi:hypothetical protein
VRTLGNAFFPNSTVPGAIPARTPPSLEMRRLSARTCDMRHTGHKGDKYETSENCRSLGEIAKQ